MAQIASCVVLLLLVALANVSSIAAEGSINAAEKKIVHTSAGELDNAVRSDVDSSELKVAVLGCRVQVPGDAEWYHVYDLFGQRVDSSSGPIREPVLIVIKPRSGKVITKLVMP